MMNSKQISRLPAIRLQDTENVVSIYQTNLKRLSNALPIEKIKYSTKLEI